MSFFLIYRRSKHKEPTSTETPHEEKFSTPTAKPDSHVFLKPAEPKSPSEGSERRFNEELERQQSCEKTVSNM